MLKIENTKDMLNFLFDQMIKLDEKDITVEQAAAQAKLASQANNLLNYELQRSIVQLKLKEQQPDINPILREIEENTDNISEVR